jgi:cysteinyl-tRNA synthetase
MFSWITRLFTKPKETSPRRAPLYLKNSLSGSKELFIPFKLDMVRMYSCGPTVYSHIHIGNLRAQLFSDILARTLQALGYRLKRVINITDVGHLVGDADQGEDKIAVGAVREKVSPKEIAERYTKLFLEDLVDLNLDTDSIEFPRATDYIREQIALAKTLEEKGFAYLLADGLYFDTQKFPSYGALGGLRDASLVSGARVKQVSGKRHPSDFVLWRKAKPKDLQQWDSPWGTGNPGWHIECSAMIRAILGQEIDIHTGGEDLAHIHHNNEIAQSEAASGRTFVHYWMHNAFLTMNGEKASKSLGNVVYLKEIKEKGLHPLALRYFFLQAHYSTPLSFSWDALQSAENALERLWKASRDVAEESGRVGVTSEIRERFLSAMHDDLGTPQALGMLWESLRSDDYSPEEKWGLIETAEAHFGLLLTTPPAEKVFTQADIPENVLALLSERESARVRKDFAEADRLRKTISEMGYQIDDSAHGPVLSRSPEHKI